MKRDECILKLQNILDGDDGEEIDDEAIRETIALLSTDDAADAEMYRWLKAQHIQDSPSWHIRMPDSEVAGKNLDELLKAAMKKDSENG